MLHLIIGPMFSGKTTQLLELFRRSKIAGKRCIMIKFSGDDRYSVEGKAPAVRTHDGNSIDCVSCKNLEEINWKDYTHFFIDEIQFFDCADRHIVELLTREASSGDISITCTGLNGDYTQKPFVFVSNLIPYASRLTFKTSICTGCQEDDAIFSVLTGEVPEGHKDGEPLIGGKERYKTLCVRCHSPKFF